VFIALAISYSSSTFVLAFTFLKYALILDHIISMGFKSGLYRGRYRTLAPTAFIASATLFILFPL